MGRNIVSVASNKSHSCKSCDGGDQSGPKEVMMPPMNDPRIISLHGEVNEYSISSVIAQLLYLANLSRQPIYLIISTYGGSVDEMFSLYDVIKALPCPVCTIGLGKIMSAGVLLLAAGKKGNRLISKSSRIMMHPISGGAEGNIFDIMNESQEMLRIHDLMIESLVKETKMSSKEINKIFASGHDFYVAAEKAIEYGIVDGFLGESKTCQVNT
jgi:ATP-dependent Clp protease, protease subunit